MKNLKSTLALLVTLLLVAFNSYSQTNACSPASLNYSSPSAGTQSVYINACATCDWEISIAYGSGATIDPMSGHGPGTVTVNIDTNPSYTDAIAISVTVPITHPVNGTSLSSNFNINQVATTPTSTISETSTTVDSGTNTTPLVFTSDVDWTATMDAWITLELSGSTQRTSSNSINSGPAGTNNLTVATDANTSLNARTGTVTFTSGGTVKTLSVTQAGAIATAIEDAEFTRLNIYPNPSTGTVHVDSKVPTSINVLNATGNIVYTGEPSMTHQIQLSKGLYFLQAENPNQKSTQKIIVE